MTTNFFGQVVSKEFDGITQFLSTVPYRVDQHVIGKPAKLVKDKICSKVEQYTPSKIKELPFTGLFRKILLTTTGYFGEPDTKNIDSLKAQVFWEKPIQFLHTSTLYTARNIYDAISQNFHAEFEVKAVAKKIHTAAMKTCGSNIDTTGAGAKLKKKIESIVQNKVRGDSLSIGDCAKSVSNAATSEILEQSTRIFLTSVFWSYYTNSSFSEHVCTLLATSAIAATVSLVSRFDKSYQKPCYVFAGLGTSYYFGPSQSLVNALSVSSLAIWTGLLANGKTNELASYQPPKTANDVKTIVTAELKQKLIQTVKNTLEYWGDTKSFEADLDQIEFSDYPFTAFDNSSSSKNRRAKTQVRFFNNQGAASFPQDVIQAVEKKNVYEQANPQTYEQSPEYWRLVFTEYEAKATYYKSQNKTDEHITCIEKIEMAKMNQCAYSNDFENFENKKEETLKYLREELQPTNLRSDKRILKLITTIEEMKHPCQNI